MTDIESPILDITNTTPCEDCDEPANKKGPKKALNASVGEGGAQKAHIISPTAVRPQRRGQASRGGGRGGREEAEGRFGVGGGGGGEERAREG